MKYKWIESPVGLLKLVAEEDSLLAILWENDKVGRVKLEVMMEDKEHPVLIKTENELKEYFSGKRKTFDIKTKLRGTPFQRTVWDCLNVIPYGSTWSYKDVALKTGYPLAVRAVGGAIGRNPISILIPCHRVIASNGSLTGFAGGLDRKKVLLDFEMTAL